MTLTWPLTPVASSVLVSVLVTIVTGVCLTAAAAAKPTPPAPPATAVPTQTNSTSTKASDVCSCNTDTQTATTAILSTTIKPTPVQGFLTVTLNSRCAGEVILHHPSSPSSAQHVCSTTEAKTFLKNVCEVKNCKGPLVWHTGPVKTAYNISGYGAQLTLCKTLKVNCTGTSTVCRCVWKSV